MRRPGDVCEGRDSEWDRCSAFSHRRHGPRGIYRSASARSGSLAATDPRHAARRRPGGCSESCIVGAPCPTSRAPNAYAICARANHPGAPKAFERLRARAANHTPAVAEEWLSLPGEASPTRTRTHNTGGWARVEAILLLLTPCAPRISEPSRSCKDARVIRAAGSPVKLRSSYPARVEVGRRVRAARVMAGGLSLRSVASATGLSSAPGRDRERPRAPARHRRDRTRAGARSADRLAALRLVGRALTSPQF